jgi:DNA topoisomerase IB
VIARIKDLAVPPAWKDVWICADPLGHLQATGIDAAGRKQYLYHLRWREHRDRAKFERMVRFGGLLPKLRRRLTTDLEGSEPTRERVLACAVRLLDVGMFRIGSEEYADDDSGIGLATIRKEHVIADADSISFDYPSKGGVRRVQTIEDPLPRELIRALKRRSEQGRTQTRDRSRRPCGRAAARQHAGRRSSRVYRPTRVRPLSVGLDDRGRPGAHRRARVTG